MIIKLCINALAFYITAYLLSGFDISGWQSLLVATVVWGILSILVKPVLLFLTLPINILTLGLFTFVINAMLLLVISSLIQGFRVEGFGSALMASVVLSFVNTFLSFVIKDKQ